MARGPQAQASNAANTAASTAAGYGSTAGGIQAGLIPQLEAESTGNIGFTPEQQSNMLTAGEQGAGGAASGIVGQAGLQAGRTRNSAATSGLMDEAARQKIRQSSTNALDVANESANLAQKKQAESQAALQGLYGTDVSAQLRAMGLEPEDINAETNAGNSGWLQNTEGILRTISGLGGNSGLKGIPGIPG